LDADQTCGACATGRHPQCWKRDRSECSCGCTEIDVGTRVRVKVYVEALEGMAFEPGTVSNRNDFLAGVILDRDGKGRTFGLGTIQVIR
jgi:hypothetical protein